MRKLETFARVKRLIDAAIDDFSLDLNGIVVLTEAASGPFVVTPLIAARAGADKVVAVTRDSRYGSAEEIEKYTRRWADEMGVGDRITVSTAHPHEHAGGVHLVTNLGFVRPINEKLINRLPADAAISLMWEPWEFRETDLELAACYQRGIPVLGTCETHPRLQTFRYVGMVALKLLLEVNVEVFRSRIIVIGSGHFGKETVEVLSANGASVLRIDPINNWNPSDGHLQRMINEADAIVLVEHTARFSLIGEESGIPQSLLEGRDIQLIHICGKIDEDAVKRARIRKNPSNPVPEGFMSVTTDYAGPRPVIDLHAAGLKVGETLVRGMRIFGNAKEAIHYALEHSPAMNFATQTLQERGLL